MTEKATHDNINWNVIEAFDDIFDVIDDDHDTLEYTDQELNQYFTNGHLYSNVNEQVILDNDQMEEDFHDIENVETEEEEQVILSQKFSQLSTKVANDESSSVNIKRRRPSNNISSGDMISVKKLKPAEKEDSLDDDQDNSYMIILEDNEVPSYLRLENSYFLYMAQTITKSNRSITIHDIQQIALFIHRRMSIYIERQIVKAYFHSMMGTLKEPECDLVEVDRRVWPMYVQSLSLKHQKTTTTTEMNQEERQVACEQLLHQQLKDMNERIEQFVQQLKEKRNTLVGFTSGMEQTIHSYVQQHGIQRLEIKRDLKIALLNYDYESEILKRKYVHEKPNDYQIDICKRLLNAKRELEKSKRELLELKYRVFYNKPMASLDSIQRSIPNLKENPSQRAIHDYEKMIHRNKMNSMAFKITEAELKFYHCLKIFDDELSTMWRNHRELIKDRGMTTALTNLIEKHLTNITDRWRDIYNYRVNYYLRNSYYQNDAMDEDKTNDIGKRIGFSSSLIIDTKHSLTDEQLRLLSRGPTYIPPCQIAISSSDQTIHDIVKKRYAPLKHELNNLFTKYRVNIALSMEIQKKVYDHFVDLFSTPVPCDLQKRALYEKQLIKSIRYSLKKDNLIVRRTSNNLNLFYLGDRKEFELKANEYLMKSDAYKVIYKKDLTSHDHKWQQDFKDRIEVMNVLLESLKKHKAIDPDLFNRLWIHATKVKVPYVYFLPDVSNENEVSVVPIITSRQSATWKLSHYLNELLRPFVDQAIKSTTFRDEADFMQKLNQYVNKDKRLRPTTLFCSIKVSNPYTLDAHENMKHEVGYFLQDNLANNKLGKVTIQTIKNLLHIYLYNNIFYYNDKVYTMIKGSPNSMALSSTLSNIYLAVWEKNILKQLKPTNELYGRYQEEIFFTWNGSNEELRFFIHDLKDKHPNIEFRSMTGSSVRFLNGFIDNRNGALSSRMFYPSITEGFTLPYVMGHPKVVYSDWLRLALIRTVCYCSSVDDFNLERIHLELTCLANGYSLIFVETHVQHFYDYFHAHAMRYTKDQAMYDKFRHNWFDYIAMQHQLTDQLQKLHDSDHLIHLHYLYELGPRCEFNQRFHHLWSQYFSQHIDLSDKKAKILLTTQQQHSLNSLLAKEKPMDSFQ